MTRYNFKETERKWQSIWAEKKTFEVQVDNTKES